MYNVKSNKNKNVKCFPTTTTLLSLPPRPLALASLALLALAPAPGAAGRLARGGPLGPGARGLGGGRPLLHLDVLKQRQASSYPWV